MASVAVNDELLFRGVVFRIPDERTGTVVALVLSSVIFGTANSGTTTDTSTGLLHTTLSGPDVLTGGTFGPEAPA